MNRRRFLALLGASALSPALPAIARTELDFSSINTYGTALSADRIGVFSHSGASLTVQEARLLANALLDFYNKQELDHEET